ncbi:MAG: hypothetical protein JWP45_266 [Mucilaginibacter sp.]|nr:hypothetical protein [Mucilaginibacter sp.]
MPNNFRLKILIQFFISPNLNHNEKEYNHFWNKKNGNPIVPDPAEMHCSINAS